MPSRTKAEAIKIVHDCALLYNQNLASKNLLFVAVRDDVTVCVETLFMPHNFMHLTGVKSKLNSEQFFRAALNNRLSVNDISLATDGTTELKLDVLPQLMKIPTSARMVGEYDNSKPLLIADKLVGTVAMAMGFVYVNGIYIPNTALKKDLRDITARETRHRVIAIFAKHRRDAEYSNLTYIAKGLSLDDEVLQTLLEGKVNLKKQKLGGG